MVWYKTAEERHGSKAVIGRLGEEKVLKWLSDQNCYYQITDYEDDRERQLLGHDIGIVPEEGQKEVFISVKTNLKAGKFFVEDSLKYGPGWWHKEDADIYFFVEKPPSNFMLSIPKVALKEYIDNNRIYRINYFGDFLYPIEVKKLTENFKDQGVVKTYGASN